MKTFPEFSASVEPQSVVAYDEWAFRGQHRFSVPAGGGWLRYLVIETADPSLVKRLQVEDCGGQRIYDVGGKRGASMYPEDDGWRIPFEWQPDGRGSLPNQNAAVPYMVNMIMQSDARVRITAHSWNFGYRYRPNVMPPYCGSVLYHSEIRFTDGANWEAGSAHPMFPQYPREILHRLWTFDNGSLVVIAKEYRAG